jgi:hypothetical protein
MVAGGARVPVECVALLSGILTFAVRCGLRSANPALGIELRGTNGTAIPVQASWLYLAPRWRRWRRNGTSPVALARNPVSSPLRCR